MPPIPDDRPFHRHHFHGPDGQRLPADACERERQRAMAEAVEDLFRQARKRPLWARLPSPTDPPIYQDADGIWHGSGWSMSNDMFTAACNHLFKPPAA